MTDDTYEFSYFVPEASSHAHTFLRTVVQRTAKSGLPLAFSARQDGKGRTTIEAGFQAGHGFKKGSKLKLTVYADPIGAALQVGWDLRTQGDAAGATLLGVITAQTGNFDQHPDIQREVAGIMQAFQQMAFLPVLEQLVEAVGGSVGGTGSGFLGA